MKKVTIEVKPYSIRELAELYGVSPKVFRNWLSLFENSIGERMGHYYTVRQVKIIFDKLGIPYLQEVE